MARVIVIHANCKNQTAKGDYAFAGSIAKDMIDLLQREEKDIDVILVCPMADIKRFNALYGEEKAGRISIEGRSVGLTSLEKFDPVDNQVIAFIDANRCKISPVELIQPILDADSKLLFIGHANQDNYMGQEAQKEYKYSVAHTQPGLLNAFSQEAILIGSAGLGDGRLGLPNFGKAAQLPELSVDEKSYFPPVPYGFMYFYDDVPNFLPSINQYMAFTNHKTYVMLGNPIAAEAASADIHSYKSLPNHVMRKMMAGADGLLVGTTGIGSTLEAMQDGKLCYYQFMQNNVHFVHAYLIAVKSLLTEQAQYQENVSASLIIKLSELLFAEKPLNQEAALETQELLKQEPIQQDLIKINQEIIENAHGKIAPRLLGFITEQHQPKPQAQLQAVCDSLATFGDKTRPNFGTAFSRAVKNRRLFELKILLQFMKPADLDQPIFLRNRTALQHVAFRGFLNVARLLIKSGCSLDFQDRDGRTAFHLAVISSDIHMVKLLIDAGASLNIRDKEGRLPQDYAPKNGFLAAEIDDYIHQIGTSAFRVGPV